MPKFLNTQSFYQELLNMINNCDHELVIIVPYIKMTNDIFKAFKNANERGVEITLVYREKKVSQQELDKLYELDNMNIMHHPNVHCKFYYDGTSAIIGSLNLYDYSIANNREMGILIELQDLDYTLEDQYSNGDDLIKEIQDIFNGSRLEKKSRETEREGFKISILKTDEESAIEILENNSRKLNKHFLNKKFKPVKHDKLGFSAICENFFDKIDVDIEPRRASLYFNNHTEELNAFHDHYIGINEFLYLDFARIKWSSLHRPVYFFHPEYTYKDLDRNDHQDSLEVWEERLNKFYDAYLDFKNRKG
jgi:hypothetical protein